MILVLLASLLIAPNFFYTKLAILSFSPLTVATLRLAFATLFLFGANLVLNKGKWVWDKTIFKYAFITGFFGTALPYSLHAYSMLHSSTILAALLTALNPIITSILSYFFISKQTLTRQSVMGVSLGMLGLLILLLPEIHNTHTSIGIVCIFLTLFGTTGHSIGLVCTKKFNLEAYDYCQMALLQVACTLLYLPLLAWLAPEPMLNPDFQVKSLVAVMTLGALVTGLGLMLYLRIMREQGVLMVSLISYCRPVIAAMVGVLFLQEVFSIHYFIAILFIYASLYLCRKPDAELVKAAA